MRRHSRGLTATGLRWVQARPATHGNSVVRAVAIAALAVAAEGCQTIKDAGSEIFSGGNSLEAVMKPTNGSAATGSVIIGPTRSGVALRVAVNGLPLDRYRVAIHTVGNCSSPNAFSAGPPWLPAGAPPDALLNLASGAPVGDGTLVMVVRLPGVTLEGPNSVIGRSVVVHQGGQGSLEAQPGVPNNRVACGVIGPVQSFF